MNIMRWFGFDNDDDDFDDDDYPEERRKPSKSSSRRENVSSKSSGIPAGGKLILFNGIASDNDKRRLREAFNSGAMILIDLHELTQIEYEQNGGKDFITFMGGVAFARNGTLIPIEPAQYLVTPRAEMFEVWPEERESE